MDHLHHLIESNGLDQDAVKEMMEGISIRIQKGQFVTFYHLYQNYLWLSPNPEDSIEARWGLKKVRDDSFPNPKCRELHCLH